MGQIEIINRSRSRDQLGEGPLWDEQAQVLWWVDIVGGCVQRLDPSSGQIQEWRVGHHVSAAVPCASGGLMLALPGGLARMDPASAALQPFVRPDADPGNRSNECRADPRGRLWLGTMSNNLEADGSSRPLRGATGGLFRIEADGRSTQILSGVGISNTLAWSPDGDRLYFADSLKGVIWRFRFDMDDGTVSERHVFAAPDAAPGAPDGSAVDEDGCLWNARWGAGLIVRFAPDGRVDRTIKVPAHHPTCVAFGGTDRTTLYITTARQELEELAPESLDGCLFAIPAGVTGLPSFRFAG